MVFTKIEKKLIKNILKKHLEELKTVERLPNDNAGEFATEVGYETFIRGIIKKLE